MPTQTAEQVIESQRRDWNRVAPGWEKWDGFFESHMAFLNHRLVGDARLQPGLRVLDLGSGTGYPALLEIAAPIQRLIARLTEAQTAEFKRLSFHAVNQFQRGDRIMFPFAVRIVAARKPL